MKQDPSLFYQQQLSQLTAEIQQLSKKRNRISLLRVITLVLGAALLYIFRQQPFYLLLPLFALALTLFLLLVKQSIRVTEQRSLLQQIVRLIQEEFTIATHQFTHRPQGENLAPPKHAYAGDLDLFGKASLFQFLHRSTGEQGHQTLANWLLAPAPDTTIRQRQAAAQELASQPAWSLRFEAYGHLQPLTLKSQDQILHWSASASQYTPNKFYKLLRFVWPLLALAALFLHLADILPSGPFYLLLLVLLVLAFYISKGIQPIYRQLDSILPSLATLSNALECIESASFRSLLLLEQQSAIATGNSLKASAAIRHLRKILDRFDYRLNPLVYIPLNTFLLWDLQQVWALENWKTIHQSAIRQWFSTIAELEALNSIGRFSFNHPGYVFPELSTAAGSFSALALGHPLIPAANCVTNDFTTSGRPAIALITGSNMAGKSTFLRSIGINQVLAMAGAPVAARQLTVSNMRIMSSMRIADNLEENTSTFYAELSKLKSIIEAVNAGEPVLLLLDEILRGTNSQDRQTGSRALIRQLIQQKATGLLATHDLALTALQAEAPTAITNYHFDVAVENEELYFDYKLKKGICTSMNASILMKKIGIEL
ncbi:MutS family DNA mismatch repair protein [Flavihumibacter sp. CACIAM 22H1]|uniref:MutS family DNA mismatch repair protein n=1 Tax=Flavihumibacter sp. CACIAM 22H1 TaxID=1812911 RepID=UPI0007A7E2F5|nr:MutS family DNA mismatch repair protein [Flavihumibacter sp. CACIAM 22H1]KYP13549.1 MAG: hypothetical protein A1D16_17480 [Flavihumibacter sp. CACIAM 22H1]